MKKRTKYRLKTFAISALWLVVVFSGLAYLTAPQTPEFRLDSVNPLNFLEGTLFALSFGLGFPVWLSVVVTVILSFLLWRMFLWIVRKLGSPSR